MEQSVNPAWLSAFSALAVVVIGLLAVLSRRFGDLKNEFEVKMRDHSNANSDEHRAVREQIQDIARTVAEHYVRRAEFDAAMRLLTETCTQVRNDIGSVHNRIDEVFRDGWRTRRGEDD